MEWGRFSEYGLLGLVVCAVIILLYKIVIWTLATTKEILQQAAEERKVWQATIEKINNAIDSHDKKADERGRYIREEHKQMIETLGRINGYKNV